MRCRRCPSCWPRWRSGSASDWPRGAWPSSSPSWSAWGRSTWRPARSIPVITVRLEGTERYVAREREALAEVTRRLAGARRAGVAPSPDDLAEARFHEAEVYDKEMALASVYATWLLAFMPVYVTVVLAVLVPLWRLDPLALWSQSRARLPAPESDGATRPARPALTRPAARTRRSRRWPGLRADQRLLLRAPAPALPRRPASPPGGACGRQTVGSGCRRRRPASRRRGPPQNSRGGPPPGPPPVRGRPRTAAGGARRAASATSRMAAITSSGCCSWM